MKRAAGTLAELNVQILEGIFAGARLENVALRLWDGTVWPDSAPRKATVALKHPGALRRMFLPGSEIGFAQAYLDDLFDFEGDLEAAFELAEVLLAGAGLGWRKSLQLSHLLHKLPEAPQARTSDRLLPRLRGRLHSVERDTQAVRFHYDLSNDFYRLWLDRNMVYSCACFQSPTDDLDAAQEHKLDYLCRKLRLKAEQRLLDLGCGWGGLMLHAARHYGIHATGITLSPRQAELAAARIAQERLGDRVTVEVRDYREMPAAERYAAVVSVGMSEHVGAGRLPEYFRAVHRLLQPAGLFLHHAIGVTASPRPSDGSSFMATYVFPDGEIPPLPAVLGAAEAAKFEIRDVESLREHYALTLRHWLRRLEAHHESALSFVSEATYRVWRLFLAGSAHCFRRGHASVYQTLLSKPDKEGSSHLPLTRRDWYV